MRIVLGVGGGIAAFKAVSLLRLLTEAAHDVTVIPTESADRFIGSATWEALSGKPVTNSVFDEVPRVNHVRLGQEADLVIVAPATADLLAKAAAGLADDLLTTTLLMAGNGVFFVPAMHTEMWQHAATQANVALLRDRGCTVMEPASGRLTGPDSGPGRLPEPVDIFDAVLVHQSLLSAGDGSSSAELGVLAHRTVVITAGGTREPLDPVRFLGNRSSGKQGVALANAALAAGASVHFIAAHMDVEPPFGAKLTSVETAAELQEAVVAAIPGADVVIMAAAVADFRPAELSGSKIKKREGRADPTITLIRNPDILRALVQERDRAGHPLLIAGFAAETGDDHGDPLTYAREKLHRKGCDLLVLNEVSGGSVFGADTNRVLLLTPEDNDENPAQEATGSKRNVADAVVLRIASLLKDRQ